MIIEDDEDLEKAQEIEIVKGSERNISKDQKSLKDP